jgi:hypothetical protein
MVWSSRLVLCLAFALGCTSAAAAALGEQRSYLQLDGEMVQGSRPYQQTVGREVILTPRWTRRAGADGKRSAGFAVPEGQGCTSYLDVSAGASVFRGGLDNKHSRVYSALLYHRKLLSSGERESGAWGVAEMPPAQTQLVAGNPAARRVLTYAMFTIAPRRVMEVEVLADFVGSCSDAQVRRGHTVRAMPWLARTTRFLGHLKRYVPAS